VVPRSPIECEPISTGPVHTACPGSNCADSVQRSYHNQRTNARKRSEHANTTTYHDAQSGIHTREHARSRCTFTPESTQSPGESAAAPGVGSEHALSQPGSLFERLVFFSDLFVHIGSTRGDRRRHFVNRAGSDRPCDPRVFSPEGLKHYGKA